MVGMPTDTGTDCSFPQVQVPLLILRSFPGTLLVGGTPVFAGEAHVVGVDDGCSFDVGCNVETKGDER